MNKQTIQDIDEALDRYHRKVMFYMNKIDALRKKRKKLMVGKIKNVPPAPVKVKFSDLPFDDDLPDFADRPVAPGTCTPS